MPPNAEFMRQRHNRRERWCTLYRFFGFWRTFLVSALHYRRKSRTKLEIFWGKHADVLRQPMGTEQCRSLLKELLKSKISLQSIVPLLLDEEAVESLRAWIHVCADCGVNNARVKYGCGCRSLCAECHRRTSPVFCECGEVINPALIKLSSRLSSRMSTRIGNNVVRSFEAIRHQVASVGFGSPEEYSMSECESPQTPSDMVISQTP